uniref:Uncharacterized protein n=1 Tax=Anguilla anguilla TaxID=7936 RepID=A0A0E9Q444_ANGAN
MVCLDKSHSKLMELYLKITYSMLVLNDEYDEKLPFLLEVTIIFNVTTF